MKQQQITTRLKGETLIKEIVEIWRGGDHKENMEGVENDPIFSLMVTALAYRANEIEGEIDVMREGLLNELSRRLIPHRQCRAIPAATIITTSILGNVGERAIGATSKFTLSGTSHTFVPLLDTLIVNGAVESVTRVDGRRWKVRITTKDPLSTLRGMSFSLSTTSFSNVSISLDNSDLTIVKPWDYADLPLSKNFSLVSQLYNNEEQFSQSNRWIDIFAQLDNKLIYIGYNNETKLHLSEREYLEFIFEFEGIAEDFNFTKQHITMNVIPIVNVKEHSVDISSHNPIVRLHSSGNGGFRQDFLGLIPPSEGSNDYLNRVLVREVGGDRFSGAMLYRFVRGLINRFSSDYYAFQSVATLRDGAKIQQLYRSLQSVADEISDMNKSETPGCYVTLTRDDSSDRDSFNVRYLTTAAEQVNDLLQPTSRFNPDKTLSLAIATAISKPLLGVAPISDELVKERVGRYNVITHDRLVTPADVKAFCIKELDVRYAIGGKLIRSISVQPRLVSNCRQTHYVMEVKINIEQTLYVKRVLNDIAFAEHMLSKLISVRSVGIHQFNIEITVE